MRFTGLFALLLSLMVAGNALAAEKFITIGTADELGVYYPAGGAICRLVKRGVQEHGLRCFVETTAGSIDNLNALRQGQQDLAFTQSGVAYEAYHGEGVFANRKPNTSLRTVFGLHMEIFTVLVRADSHIRTVTDLAGKRIFNGGAGSGTKSLFEYVAKAEGIGKSFREIEGFKASEQAAALCNKKVDAIIYTAGHPNGATQEVTNRCAVRIIPIADDVIDDIIAGAPYFHKAVIPGGMYHGVDKPVASFGVRAMLMTSAEEDENNVYDVVKAVFNNLDNFKTLHPVFATLTRESMVQDDVGIPMHPGAIRFYKEVGLMH